VLEVADCTPLTARQPHGSKLLDRSALTAGSPSDFYCQRLPRSEHEIQVTPEVCVPTGEVQQWARGSRFLFPTESEVADLRYFFEESMTDEESAMYRRHRNLRTIVDIVGALRVARSDLQYQRLLVVLAVWTQREWEDFGNKGPAWLPATPQAKEKALKEMTKVIYTPLSEEEKN
jgi:hypothetical protein